MKKIITYLAIKAFNIFMPFFLMIFGGVVGLLPIVMAAVTEKGLWFAGLIISVPMAIVIITFTNNFTEWDDLWEFDDLKQLIYEYHIQKRHERDIIKNQNVPSNFDSPGRSPEDQRFHEYMEDNPR